jgi:hypothetical protein
MSVVSIAEAWPAPGKPFTVAESYWVVVPDRDGPEVIVFELDHGRYQEVAHVAGSEVFTAHRPFPVEVIPSRLVARLQPGGR